MTIEYLHWLCLDCRTNGIAEVFTTRDQALSSLRQQHSVLSPGCSADLSVIDGRGDQVRRAGRGIAA